MILTIEKLVHTSYEEGVGNRWPGADRRLTSSYPASKLMITRAHHILQVEPTRRNAIGSQNLEQRASTLIA